MGVRAGAGSQELGPGPNMLAGRCRVSLGRREVEKVHGTYFMVGGGGDSSFTPNPPQVWAWQDAWASQGPGVLFCVVLVGVGVGVMAEISAPSFIQHKH